MVVIVGFYEDLLDAPLVLLFSGLKGYSFSIRRNNKMAWTCEVFADTTFYPTDADMGDAYMRITSPTGESTTRGYYPVPTQGTGGSSYGSHIVSRLGEVRRDNQTGAIARLTTVQKDCVGQHHAPEQTGDQ